MEVSTDTTFDVVVLGVFLKIKASTDTIVIYAALIGILIIFIGEKLFLRDIKPENRSQYDTYYFLIVSTCSNSIDLVAHSASFFFSASVNRVSQFAKI